MVTLDREAYLQHYGILRRSGRYPWGSGATQSSRNRMFLDSVTDLRRQGLSDVEVVKGLGLESTTQLRALYSIATNQQREERMAMVRRLKDKGVGASEIGRRMGISEGTVRSLYAQATRDREDALRSTAEMLKRQVAEKRLIDVGSGVEKQLDISDTRLNTALAMLKEEGYKVHTITVKQLGTGKDTRVKVLGPPDSTLREVFQNKADIKLIDQSSDDGGRSFYGLYPPKSIDSSRVQVKYDEDGGSKADGVIYVRPGVDDVTLGNSRYAQVRIAVDGTHYLKGMAIYRDDLPDGIDLVFNTNKTNTGNKLDAMKEMKLDDPDNPFGAVFKGNGKGQITRILPDGSREVTSVMNIVNEEGDWGKWSGSISAQALSKQSPALAKEQLGITYDRRQREFDEIMQLTNPTVRKKLLADFSDSVDAAAVHLKAANIPRQRWQVIIPINELKSDEVYAPNFRDGESVALIRYPHGGKFEIPELTVNNKNRAAKKILGSDAKDAIGINASVAERLSGADFDGDTVLVIPNNNRKIKSDPALERLRDFNPKTEYKLPEGGKRITASGMQKQMGDVSNLITDMTIKQASTDELARAVRHSMVVIDSYKHSLDYKRSAADHGIKQLKEKYQNSASGGASTLISRSGLNAGERIPKRKPRPYAEGGPIDKETGKKVYVETGEEYVDRNGKTVRKTEKVPRLSIVDDVSVYSSGTPMERVYVDHANKLKELGNRARKEMINTPSLTYSPSAKRIYAPEVAALDAKLSLAIANRPRERQAQLIANEVVRLKREAKPVMESDERKKIEQQALNEARARLNAKKPSIVPTPKEWEAIQAGAISNAKLETILANTDIDQIRRLATPKIVKLMTPAKASRAASMLDRGFTREEVASALGVSLSTLDNTLYGVDD